MSTFDETLASNTVQSVNYVPNTSFKVCPCNRTHRTCDAFCCCDEDCDQKTRDVWASADTCLDKPPEEIKGQYFGKCLNREEIHSYNTKQGIYNYVDPLT